MPKEHEAEISGQIRSKRISSPDQLADYLRVTNVGVWVMLSVIILLLAAIFVWSCVGRLETTVASQATVTDSTAQITVINNANVVPGMTARIGNLEFQISEVKHDETGLVLAYGPVNLVNGKYGALIVVDSVAPISFLLNAS